MIFTWCCLFGLSGTHLYFARLCDSCFISCKSLSRLDHKCFCWKSKARQNIQAFHVHIHLIGWWNCSMAETEEFRQNLWVINQPEAVAILKPPLQTPWFLAVNAETSSSFVIFPQCWRLIDVHAQKDQARIQEKSQGTQTLNSKGSNSPWDTWAQTRFQQNCFCTKERDFLFCAFCIDYRLKAHIQDFGQRPKTLEPKVTQIYLWLLNSSQKTR